MEKACYLASRSGCASRDAVLFDQSLQARARSEVVAFTDFSTDIVPDAENAYFAMLGFHAEPDRDIHAVGVAFASAVKQALDENPASRPPGGESSSDLIRLVFQATPRSYANIGKPVV